MWLIAFAIVLLVVVAPVMIAARIVGAGRTGFGYSLLALIVSFFIVGIAMRLLHLGGLLGFLVAPVGFMLILDTTYLRGLGIVILQYIITAVLVVIVAFTALGSMLHMKDMIHDIQHDATPSQSV